MTNQTRHRNIDPTDISHYAGLTADDARGKWEARDIAHYAAESTGHIVMVHRDQDGDPVIERMDGATFTVALDYTDGTIDGYVYSTTNRDDQHDETGGGTIADNHGVAALINRIIDWAAQTEI